MTTAKSNLNIQLDTSIGVEEDGLTVHSFIDINGIQTDSAIKSKLSYEDIIQYLIESSLINKDGVETLNEDSEDTKMIISEIEALQKFIDMYKKRVQKAIENGKK